MSYRGSVVGVGVVIWVLRIAMEAGRAASKISGTPAREKPAWLCVYIYIYNVVHVCIYIYIYIYIYLYIYIHKITAKKENI